MTDIAILVLTLAGFLALHLAMERHQRDWLGRKLPRSSKVTLRMTGAALLLLAFIVAGLGAGWGYGTLVWFGWLTIAAVAILSLNLVREETAGRRNR